MLWKPSGKARIASDFSTLLRIKQGEKRKRCHPKSDFRLWQATFFSTKNPIKKRAINNRRLLIAAEFHFVHSAEKDSYEHHKLAQNSVSFSCQSKQAKRGECLPSERLVQGKRHVGKKALLAHCTFTISKVYLNLQYFCLIEIWKSEAPLPPGQSPDFKY